MKSLITLVLILFLPTSLFAADIRESDVKAFLDNWLAAQNTGAYSSYANMYAAKFQGIKRSGDRTSRYNHDTWMKDRKRMFKNKMLVSAGTVKIQTVETSATVRFEQIWESKGYRDKGDKQLYLILENDQLRIAREDMLASKVLVGKNRILDATNFPFAFAIKEGIVIEGISIKPEYIKGKPSLTSTQPDHVASTSVNINLLPKNIQSLVGMPVRLYNAKGSCESQINGFRLVSKEVPHFGEIQRWKEEKIPVSRIADKVFSEGQLHLVATTESCSGDFAKDARLSQSPIAAPQKLDKAMKNRVWSAFKALPLYKKEIKPYIKDMTNENIQKFVVNHNGKTSTWVSIFITGDQSCGSEGGTLGSLWEVVEHSNSLSLKWIMYLDEDLDYATDIENDGIPEFYYRYNSPSAFTYFGFISGRNIKNNDRRFDESAFHDCPC